MDSQKVLIYLLKDGITIWLWCWRQVSTGGGTLSRLVHLQIAVPEAFILGADEHHVDAGSTINLVCIIEKVPTYSYLKPIRTSTLVYITEQITNYLFQIELIFQNIISNVFNIG